MNLLYYRNISYSNLLFQLKCCGVNNVSDWTQNPDKDQFNFEGLINKPEGCCEIDRNDKDLNAAEMKVEYYRNYLTFLMNFLGMP